MTSSYVYSEQDATTYDEDLASEFEPSVIGPAVDHLRDLAEDGPALEFAIGTGRIGVPLAAAGVSVSGIELSEPMIARLRRKVDEQTLPVVLGDMATATVPGEFSLVYLVFNTISNLRTQAEQVQCFRNAARHLRPRGRFVIELWVPPLHRLRPGNDAVAMEVRDGYAAFDTYDVATQACTSQSYRRGADGTVRHDIGRFRYLWPSECDLMAQLAGLEREARHEDWSGGPFTSTSGKHVSVWRKVT